MNPRQRTLLTKRIPHVRSFFLDDFGFLNIQWNIAHFERIRVASALCQERQSTWLSRVAATTTRSYGGGQGTRFQPFPQK